MNLESTWQYELSYSKYGPSELIAGLYTIEDRLVSDIFQTCQLFLESKGAVVKGQLFFFDSLPLRLYCTFHPIERSLAVMILPVRPTRSEIVKTSIKIDGFGAIRAVEFTAPRSAQGRKLDRLPRIIQTQLQIAYSALENKFKSCFKAFGAYIFDNLYNVLNGEIRKRHKDALLGKAFFNVTLRKESKFRYFFDSERLQSLIDYFKAHQVEEYSPIELVATLMAGEATDTMNLLMHPGIGEFAYLPSQAFVTLEEDLKFWSSEALLLEYKDLASFTITMNSKMNFQVNCLRELEHEFAGVFAGARESLQHQFEQNVKRYSRHVRDLTRIPRPRANISTARALADTLVSLFGRFTAEVFKNSLQP
jgi:hypothetical protein